MPRTQLVEGSLVLTQDGWQTLAGSKTSCVIYGIDRRGRLAQESVTYEPKLEAAHCVFFMTEADFGLFSADTRLIDSAGQSRRAGNVVENMLITEIFLESVPDLPSLSVGIRSVDALWDMLKDGAASETKDRLVMRCRGEREIILGASDDFPIVKCGGRPFLIINRNELDAGLSNNWVETINKISDKWLKNDDGVLELERSERMIGIWILSARRRTNSSYRLMCDTLQHTTLVRIEEDVDGKVSGISKGTCAFYAVDSLLEVTMQWSDPSWNPIANGLVVAGVR